MLTRKIDQTMSDLQVPRALLDRLLPKGRQLRVRTGQMVVSHGSTANDVFIILSGRFEVLLTARDGQLVVVRDLAPGELFGDLAAIDGCPRSATVLAAEDGRVASIASEQFLKGIEEVPSAGLWLVRRYAQEVRRLTDRVFELSAFAVRDRLKCELFRMVMQSRSTDLGLLQPPPRHEAIANRIGSQREAVTRELARLGALGVVSREKGAMRVNVPKLAALLRREIGDGVHLPLDGNAKTSYLFD